MTPESLVLITGFGPFERVLENPSGELARRLADRPPPASEVRSTVLPVSFRRAPLALDELLASLSPRVPDLFLGLGVQPGPGFRIELRASGRPWGPRGGKERPDVDGETAARAYDSAGTGNAGVPSELRSALEPRLRGLPEALGTDPLSLSEDAGGYVCECLYHHLLVRAREVKRPGVFVHVPPAAACPVEEQERVVRSILSFLLER